MLGAIFGAACAGLLLLQYNQQREIDHLLANVAQERQELLGRLIELTGQPLQQFARDYSVWDDMVTFAQEPDREWAKVNIDASLTTFNAAAAWVLRTDGTPIYSAVRDGAGGDAPLPLPAEELGALFKQQRFPHFFLETPAGVIELQGAPIQPSADLKRESPATGWFLVARQWDANQIAALAQMMQSRVHLRRPGEPATPAEAGEIQLQRDLPAPHGQPVAMLHVQHRPAQLDLMLSYNRDQAGLFVLQSITVVLLLGLCLHRWVLQPFARIGESLAAHDLQPIVPMFERSDEIGKIARLVRSSFAARTELERALAERVQLGRDLHDGVIQSIYAAGMSLACVRAQLRDRPDEAAARLDQTRAALNETIRDVRNFITGLEPEALHRKTFSQAIEALIDLYRQDQSCAFKVMIDDDLAARLPPEHRVHALQIAREALSNALRHSGARTVVVRLQAEAGEAILEIRDDGRGFDASTAHPPGRGLANLAARAQGLGAILTVSSEPFHGTCVRLAVPLPILS